MGGESALVEFNERFYQKAKKALHDLFDAAQKRHELYFAFALTPEMRGTQDAGWNTAVESFRVFDEYSAFLKNRESNPMKYRIAMAFYCHLAEASGFYEIPKNMLRISEGLPHLSWPFQQLVQCHKETGDIIAPNANKVLKDLVGHSKNLKFNELSEVFRDAFDPDIRNGYAHADYILWSDGLRLPKRNGGKARIIPWNEFALHLERGITFFNILRNTVLEYICLYEPAKTIRASLNGEPEKDWRISFDSERGEFEISNSK